MAVRGLNHSRQANPPKGDGPTIEDLSQFVTVIKDRHIIVGERGQDGFRCGCVSMKGESLVRRGDRCGRQAGT